MDNSHFNQESTCGKCYCGGWPKTPLACLLWEDAPRLGQACEITCPVEEVKSEALQAFLGECGLWLIKGSRYCCWREYAIWGAEGRYGSLIQDALGDWVVTNHRGLVQTYGESILVALSKWWEGRQSKKQMWLSYKPSWWE